MSDMHFHSGASDEDKALLKNYAKVLAGTAAVVVVVGYIWHRRVLDNTITLSQLAVQDTMWRSFDEGVRYGVQLSKEVGFEAAQAVKSGSEYAFGAFDRPA